MPSLMSMEDLFYGPPEPTWILPTPDEAPPRRYKEREFVEPPRGQYKERELVEPPRRLYKPEPRPVVFYEPRRPPAVHDGIRPIERLARVHTVPEPVPIAAHEEIRKVVEVPVPVPVPVHVAPPPQPPVVVPPPPAPPVVVKDIVPPIQRPFIHLPIELKVPMCCEKCAKKVKDRLLDLEGVENVVTDQYNQKVIVYGHVDPTRVLNRVKHVKKKSAFWDMTVDYSKEYRRAQQAQAEAARAEAAARADAAAAKAEIQAKALAAPDAPKVVVKLPQEKNGPKVMAILPADHKENAMPYAVNSRVHSERYVSPPKAYRQEFYHPEPRHSTRSELYYDMPHGQDMRRSEFYNGRHPNPYSNY